MIKSFRPIRPLLCHKIETNQKNTNTYVNQYCFDVGPLSTTLAQHQNNIASMSLVYFFVFLKMDNSSVGSDAESRARRLVQYAVDALDEEDIHITDNVPPGQQDQKNYITKPNPRPHTSSAAASSVQDDTPVTTDAESVLTLKKTVVLLSERVLQELLIYLISFILSLFFYNQSSFFKTRITR